MTFLFHCLISGFLRWLNHTAVKALDGLGVLWLGQPLDGRAYKEGRCWTPRTLTAADYLDLKRPCHRLASYTAKWSCFCTRTDGCFACFTTYLAHLLSEIIKRCFWFAHPPPPSTPLSSDPRMLSLFLTGSDLLSNTFQHPTPRRQTLIYPNVHRAFIFAHFLASFGLLPRWNIAASTCVFSRLISSSERLWSALNHKQLYVLASLWLWGLFVFPSLCVPVIVCRFVFFSFGCSDTNCTDWMLREVGEMNHLVNASFSIFKSTFLVEVGPLLLLLSLLVSHSSVKEFNHLIFGNTCINNMSCQDLPR